VSVLQFKSNVNRASTSFARWADCAAHGQLLAAAYCRDILPSPRLSGAIQQTPCFAVFFVLRLASGG